MLTPARRLTAPAAGAALLQTLRRTAALSPSEATAALLSTCRRTRQPQSQRVAVAFFTERGARRRISIPKLPQELAMLWSGFTARRFGRRGSASLSCSLRAERTPPLCPRLPFRPAQILTHSLTRSLRASGDNRVKHLEPFSGIKYMQQHAASRLHPGHTARRLTSIAGTRQLTTQAGPGSVRIIRRRGCLWRNTSC